MNPFKSNPFASNAFAVYTFGGGGAPVPPIPVPAAVGASSGGWGGGKGMMMEELPDEAKGLDSEVSTHATVSEARNARRFLDLGVKSSTELRRTATELRAKIRELEVKLAEATGRESVSLNLYMSALGEIRKLTAVAAAAEAKIEEMKAKEAISHFHPDPEADVVYDYTPLENISLPSFELIWKNVLAGVHGIPRVKTKTEPFPWTEMSFAAMGFVISANAPKNWKYTRAVGYACATALAISAFRKLLKHLA
jgi:hypothetical protein